MNTLQNYVYFILDRAIRDEVEVNVKWANASVSSPLSYDLVAEEYTVRCGHMTLVFVLEDVEGVNIHNCGGAESMPYIVVTLK